ncbi:MAG: hypothetical protein HUU26_05945 [Gemmatimonadaceae bacterium]|nr:hypothetical protein [Gemmatimonadaceae bacterium]
MLRGRALRITAIPVTAVTLFGACYRYVPPPNGEISLGSSYRGYLTPEGSGQVARLMGEGVLRFDGRVVSIVDTAYLVAMGATVKHSDPRPLIWTGEHLWVPKAAVNRFELRELDRPRTVRAALIYAGSIALLGAAWFRIRGGASGNCCIEPPPPP